MNENQTRSHRVKLILQASNLRTKSSFTSVFRAKSSPFAVVSKLAPLGRTQEEPTIIGQTEPISNSLQPQWTKYFILDYEFGRELFLDVSIYDDRNKKQMASTRIEVGSVLGRRHNRSAKRLHPYGTLYAQIVPFETPKTSRTLHFQLQADLKEKSECYFEVHRRDYFDSGALWTPVFRSNLVPSMERGMRCFEKCSIPLNDIASDNVDIYDCPFRIMFWNHRKVKRHAVVGSLETTIAGLMDALQSQNSMKLMKGEVVGDDFTMITSIEFSGGEDTDTDNYTDVGYNVSANSSLPIALPVQFPVPIPAPLKPTFVDYITGGCELDLSVAIDFTSSNGNPLNPGTPHFIDNNSLNEYERAMVACGSIVAKYDSDQSSQVWGFGAKYGGITRHIFQVGDNSHVRGVQGILEAYRSTFKRGLCMSSPVVYTDVIKIAAKTANMKFEKASSEGRQSYSILLILTHGCVSDINATKAALKEAASAPLSIILVGIGRNDFSAMTFLDDFQETEGGRDICNFVKFDASKDRTAFAREALNEIPNQLSSYFISRDILPSKTESEPNDIPIDEDDTNINYRVLHSFDESGTLQISEKTQTPSLSSEY